MIPASENTDREDPFNLERFLAAQAGAYADALAELRSGQKRGHWMWYLFPQIVGLGFSSRSEYYAIRSPAEARAYLAHPVLGARLSECAEAVLGVEGRSISEILGYPDDLKLRSSMTLFEAVAAPGAPFASVLEKYYQGKRDDRTLAILSRLATGAA